MAPIDGAIGMKIDINLPQTTDVNISKAQPSKASGLGGVRSPRSKCAPILYKYKLTTPGQRTRTRLQTLPNQRPHGGDCVATHTKKKIEKLKINAKNAFLSFSEYSVK